MRLIKLPLGAEAPFDWKALVAEVTGAAAQGAGAPSGLQRIDDFGANPGGLSMHMHLPPGLPAPAPLVVILHGCGQSAAAYDRGAGWSALADRLGFAVLAPEQDRSNNMNGCFSWFQPGDTQRGQGEAASIRQMVAHALDAYGLDRRRVFVTGLSAGGAMTSVMLAAYPEVFAGGAVIAGLPYGAADTVQEGLSSMRVSPDRSARAWGDLVRAASPHPGPWPRVSVWHGDADYTVSATNAAAIEAQWADLHGLAGPATEEERIDGHLRRAWSGPAGERLIESYSLAGMGHGTPISPGDGPGQCGAQGAFILDVGVSSSFRIAEFWGLTDAEPQAAAAETTALTVRPTGPEPDVTYLDFQPVPDSEQAEARPEKSGPGAIIEKALRAAGLM